MDNVKTYTARNGKTRYRPSLSLLQMLDSDSEGFCIGCGEQQSGVEPDASRYECECCGENTVYGAAELALRGICF